MELLYFQALQLTPHSHGVLERRDSQHGGKGHLVNPCHVPESEWLLLVLYDHALSPVSEERFGNELLPSMSRCGKGDS